MSRVPLIQPNQNGLFCEVGGFYIDPWRSVERAVITHAHSDHARSGSRAYLCSRRGEGVLRHRIGSAAPIESLPFGETTMINGVQVSLHPAGHILGSAQVRVEHQGEVWVVSGDYKTAPDAAAENFEPVRCDTFITECTFGLPIYRWPAQSEVFADINRWWRANQALGRTSIVLAYSLGKAQRVLAGVDASIGPIAVHGAVAPFLPLYRREGVALPEVETLTKDNAADYRGKGLVVAPGAVQGTTWLKKIAPNSLAFASGWMAVRGARRRLSLDRGFVLSDHVDWTGLIDAVKATGAENIGATHGHTAPFIRYAREVMGLNAYNVPSRYEGERIDREEPEEPQTELPL
ncbi:ligase-associated DNA damage response exonuclease [Cerasicoccus frondis]|uniref:ligase-associated DNA damage response exonuclease n=1 Tax=Cerasicoccus frondis TaxID=490090 RepID=UPI002852CBB2|nr:ligase-associated DNA damage response exonuclease [Cerasicoccus frondis]